MITRREWMGMTLGATAGLAVDPQLLSALQTRELIRKAIPKTGERLPVVGLGSSATFAQVARSEDVDALRGVLRTLAEGGGTIFDTAPGYGASEEVAGGIAQELDIEQRLFWATKLNVARGGRGADPAAARAQLETSFRRIGKPVIDLIQVHNMGDPATQLPILRELKEQGRIRYYGITTTDEDEYDDIAAVMRREPLDFIGIDYAVDNRGTEQVVLPLAQERGIAVLAYAPFGRTRLFQRVGQRSLPDWASELDATTWAQFFLKFVISHPAITATTPATSQPRNMLDNLGGAVGRVPDQAMRRRMVELIDALPTV
jgi:aryl-alcohol dehydrogenase-like predicted oxidoreductase